MIKVLKGQWVPRVIPEKKGNAAKTVVRDPLETTARTAQTVLMARQVKMVQLVIKVHRDRLA